MSDERAGALRVRWIEPAEGGPAAPLVVLLHGFGAPGDDLLPLARLLASRLPRARFALPAGPVVLGAGFLGDARAWWELDVRKLEAAIASGRPRDLSGEDPPGLAGAREALLGCLAAIEARGLRPGPLVLGGFSQGAMLAADAVLRGGLRPDGLVLLSGALLAEREWLARLPERAGLPVFQSHGRADPLLSFAAAERLRDALAAAGLPVAWTPFSGEHEIPPPVLGALLGWLSERLGA